jgi:hypothetical protein
MSESFNPPAGVISNAKRGLELRREFNRGGTEVGVARARSLSNGQGIPLETIRRMVSYFARHEVDKKGKDWGNASNPSAGYIAWLLWGGDAGWRWAKAIVERENAKALRADAGYSEIVSADLSPIEDEAEFDRIGCNESVGDNRRGTPTHKISAVRDMWLNGCR